MAGTEPDRVGTCTQLDEKAAVRGYMDSLKGTGVGCFSFETGDTQGKTPSSRVALAQRVPL